MSRDPIERLPVGSYALPPPRPGMPAELWTRWSTDDGNARLTRRMAGLGRHTNDPHALRLVAGRILADLPAARGRYVAASGRCPWCSTTALGSRHELQLGGCLDCIETRHPAELAAVAAAARRAMDEARAA